MTDAEFIRMRLAEGRPRPECESQARATLWLRLLALFRSTAPARQA